MANSESGVQTQARLELARIGGLPMRNNVGAAVDDTGRHVRYGLMNESPQMNRQFKSSDLICPIPLVIQQHHVGRTWAVFGALETKRPGWHLTDGNERGQAQLRFINLVRSVGGIADFVTDQSDIRRIVSQFYE